VVHLTHRQIPNKTYLAQTGLVCVCVMSGVYVYVSAVTCALLALCTLVWFTIGRNAFVPLHFVDQRGRSPPQFLLLSACCAFPCALVLGVAIPAYNAIIQSDAYFAATQSFLVCEFFWIGASATRSTWLNGAVLFCAAASLTASIWIGIEDLSAEGVAGDDSCNEASIKFILVFSIPFFNVWLNDLLFYVFMFHQLKDNTATASGWKKGARTNVYMGTPF